MRIQCFLASVFLLWSTLSSASALVINEIMSANNSVFVDCDGDYSDWIELHNNGDSAVDLTGYGLSDSADEPMRWVFPALSLKPDGYIVVVASGKDKANATEPHTNFKLKASGETLFLLAPDGTAIDSVSARAIPSDISFGRDPDNTGNWMFFDVPTPAAANTTKGYRAIAGPVLMSHDGGLYGSGITVALGCATPGSAIRYTVNGFDPDETSMLYKEPIAINKTTVLKAKSFASDALPGAVTVNTYLIGTHHTMPIISLSSQNIDYIYTTTVAYGSNAEEPEKPVHIEFYEPDGTIGFNIVAGLRLHGLGRYSKIIPKNFAIMARDSYGTDTIKYRVFPDLPFKSFSSLVLRNPRLNLIFRDVLGYKLTKDIDLDGQSFRPAVLYVNGTYWGMVDVREKLNEDYLASHHDVDPDKVDMLETVSATNHPIVIEGDSKQYDALVDFVQKNDLRNDANYAYVGTQMDIDEFMRYYACQIYFGNRDWPYQNYKWWRPKTENGRWRWLLYDIDLGFWDYEYDTLSALTSLYGSEIIPPWITVIFRGLLVNDHFRHAFINLLADYQATIFSPEKTLEAIHEIQTLVEPEMPAHIQYWTARNSAEKKIPLEFIDSMDDWYRNIGYVEEYVTKRWEQLNNHLRAKFALTGSADMSLVVSPPGAGRIRLNTLTITDFPMTQTRFMNVPAPVVAEPSPGYRFVRWEGIESAGDSIAVTMTKDVALTAVFEKTGENIVISEINYNSEKAFDTGDWVELYNAGTRTLDLTGWNFRDEDDTHVFALPAGLVMKPGEYLVLCQDLAKFSTLFPNVTNAIGSFDFGLGNGGELLRLFDNGGKLADFVEYRDTIPWPEEPDGKGSTLSLKNPELDNSLPGSWSSSTGHGSPGGVNGPSKIDSSVPASFSLRNAYPNPFNSSTAIEFSIPREGHVELTVYDSTGRKVTTLLSRSMTAGSHRVLWRAVDDTVVAAASGVYFVCLKFGDARSTKRMMLMK